MISVQSPQFSNSNKIELNSQLSPSFRNKRAPSVQDMQSSSHWNRVNSCKKMDSPSKWAQNKRKRSNNSQHRIKSKNISIQAQNMVDVEYLKEQFKTLKNAYQDLILQKVKSMEEVKNIKLDNSKLKNDNEKLAKELERFKSKASFLEHEIERIKKQSCKLIEIEQFKARKLEENLHDKQKAIKKLMTSFECEDISGFCQSTVPTASNNEDESYTFQAKPLHAQSISELPAEESLTISHDKTLSNLSNYSNFISISLTSMMESESQYRHELSTKRNKNQSFNNHEGETSSIGDGNDHNTDKNSNKSKGADGFKKLRKQIGKKLEVNIDEKHKQFLQQALVPKTPLDRKISKSTKGSKARLKKDDENSENRSSKKKIMHR